MNPKKDSKQPPMLHKKTEPHIITIQFDTLRYILYTFLEKAAKSRSWIAPLGLIISFGLTMIVSDFKDRFGLSAEQWQIIIIVGIGACSIWLTYAFVQLYKVPTFPSLIQDIIANSSIKDEHRALFFLKALSEDKLPRILVYRDIIWDCYLFPHMKIPQYTEIELLKGSLEKFIATSLGLSLDDLVINYLEDSDLTSYKYSDFHKQGASYVFRFFSVIIRAAGKAHELAKKQFEVGGRRYYWLTLDEMENDPNTARKNIDVTRHVHDNYDLFFNKVPNSIPKLINNE